MLALMSPRPATMDAPALPALEWREPQLAAANLQRIAAVSPSVARVLANVLDEVADPDAALNLFERFCESASRDVLGLLEAKPLLGHYAAVVFGTAHFLGDTLIRDPALLTTLQDQRKLEHSCSADDYARSLRTFLSGGEDDLSRRLALFKRREYVRIMLRDVLGIATLGQITAEISALTDALIAAALSASFGELQHRYQPGASTAAIEDFAVLGLGKLGGDELNYSSDVDVMFLFGERSAEAERDVSAREFFIRLAQRTSEVLTSLTAEGAVLRVDLRLRPQGREGEPAIGLRNAVHYYANAAKDWELQAMLKARHVAGDASLSRAFVSAVQPLVYQRELNFAAIATALASREKTVARRSKERGIDVKLDRGGIRDIEFLSQCLQRVYGGAEPWLRAAGTLLSLQKLHDKGHLTGKDFHELSTAYEFLRRVEHRLQLRRGQQTHRLPEDAGEARVLRRSLAQSARQEEPPADVRATVLARMAAVAAIYRRIVHQHEVRPATGFRLEAEPPALAGEMSLRQALQHLATESPAAAAVVERTQLSATGRRNLHRFLSAAFTDAERLATIVRRPRSLERALSLFETSEFLTELLVRHPEEVALLDSAVPDESGLFGAPPGGDAATRLARLRQGHRRAIFSSAAADVNQHRSVYDSLAETTAAADAAIRDAVALADPPAGFTVLALGRLGTREFDLASDADLLFLYADVATAAPALRAAERILHALAAYTQEGAVFPVDTRLRPRGMEGELVITPAQLAAYFVNEAQPWEALSYTKLRFVAGDEDTAQAAFAAVRGALPRFSADPAFATAVRAMRTKLQESAPSADFKFGPGGFYDVDFVVTYLMLRAGIAPPRGNTGALLQTLALPESDRLLLGNAAELLRATDHIIRLVTGRSRHTLPNAARPRQIVERLVSAITRRALHQGLDAELTATRKNVRAAYERLVA